MNKQHLQEFLRSHTLSQLERNLRRELVLALVFFGLIGAFLLFGTFQAIDSAHAAPSGVQASTRK